MSDISTNEAYRNYLIVSISSIPGSFAGMYLSESSFGRRYTMSFATYGVGLSLLLFVTFRTSTQQLLIICIAGMLQNVMFGVIYCYTPEVFPSKVRGTAVGITSGLGRISGCLAPLITGIFLEKGMIMAIVCLSAGLFAVTGTLMLMLPLETQGSAAI